MCRGSFFAEWPYCLRCLYMHGLRSERDVEYYGSVLATASSALCGTPTPTAQFAADFSGARTAVPYPPTGATASSDAAVGQTAVSLYFTATGPQGPGQITGAAAAATATRLFTAPRATPTASPGAGESAGSAVRVGPSSPPAAASGSDSRAKPTESGSSAVPVRVGAVGLVAAVVAVAGAAVIA